MKRRIHDGRALYCLAPLLLALAACGAGGDAGGSGAEPANAPSQGAATAATEIVTSGRLVLTVEKTHTAPDGRRCVLDVTAHNDTRTQALNVQVAWMAQTEGFGNVSDYQVIGDFEPGELRRLQLGLYGTPCDALRELTLSRAVCTVGPVADTPQSCADLVVFDTRRAFGAG